MIETLLYLAILSVVGALMTGILTNVVRINIQETSGNEVTSQLNSVMQNINSLVRQSSYIEIATSTTVTTLKLRMYDKAKDPTCIYVENNVIKLAQGPDSVNPQNCASATSDLTTSKVTANRLNFQKITYYPGHDTVSVDIQLSYNSTNPQAQISRALQTTIGRVSAATFDDNLIPGTNNTFDLGLSGSSWRNAYFSGNVGIGTTGPASLLEVSSATGGITKGLRLTNSGVGGQAFNIFPGTASPDAGLITFGDGTGWKFHIGKNSDSGATKFVTVQDNGNVGIGTTNPGAKLDVRPVLFASNQNGGIRIGTAGGEWLNQISLKSDASGVPRLAFDLTSNESGAMAETLTLLRGGNVGIGTSSPTSAKLVISTVAGAEGLDLATADSYANFRVIRNSLNAGDKDMYIGYLSGAISSLHLYSNNAETLTVKAGNVGIGTTNPGTNINSGSSYFRPDPSGKLLDVYSANNESVLNLISNQDASGAHLGGIYFTRSAGQDDAHMNVAGIQSRQVGTGIYAGGELWFFTKRSLFGVVTDEARMVIKDTGNVGIGITTPSEKLDVRGNIKLHSDGSLYAPGGVENLRIIRGTVNGDGTINQGSGFTVNNPSTGVFDINFTTAFSIKPTVVCSGMHPTDGANTDGVIQCLVNHPNQITTTVARLIITDGANAIRNSPFSFIAIGPR